MARRLKNVIFILTVGEGDFEWRCSRYPTVSESVVERYRDREAE
jgi:hypothetical protein